MIQNSARQLRRAVGETCATLVNAAEPKLCLSGGREEERCPAERGMALAVKYADDLARKNSEALSFIPTPRLEEYYLRGQLLIATENDEPCGFLIYGNSWPRMRIYQACIQYDARRRQQGLALIAQLRERAASRQVIDISLWCADDLPANEFWEAVGFTQVGDREGGRRRARRHHLWMTQVGPSLFTIPAKRTAPAACGVGGNAPLIQLPPGPNLCVRSVLTDAVTDDDVSLQPRHAANYGSEVIEGVRIPISPLRNPI